MKKLLVLASVAAITVSAFSSCGGGSSLKSDEDSLAYAIGVNLGLQMKEDPYITSLGPIMSGIKKAFGGSEKMTMDEAQMVIQEFYMTKLPKKNRQESEAFLEQIEKQPNVQKTESGLLYEIIEAGDPEVKAVNDKDVVKVVYEGKTRKGDVFDSSKERGDTVEFALSNVIKGWTEGMKLVGKGGKIKLWIPSDLAYGEMGGGRMIGPNEAITFEVDLVDVVPAPAEEEKK